MKHLFYLIILPVCLGSCSPSGSTLAAGDPAPAGESKGMPTSSGPLDLATTLKLAGARDIDVEFARQRLIEARGQHESERLRFFPTLQPGIGYHRIEGRDQDNQGAMFDVTRQTYSPNMAIVAELNLGDAIYRNLAAKRTTDARVEGLRRQRLEAMMESGTSFYQLAFANALERISRDAVALNLDQERQLTAAIEAGVALKTDLLRIKVQKRRNEMRVRQAAELANRASARLAESLRLPNTVQLETSARALSPVKMIMVNPDSAQSLIDKTQGAHPAVAEAAALTASAEKSRDAAIYGPLVPTLIASSTYGGLGGGRGGDLGNFGDRHETIVGFSWRIGAGGLFDKGRQKAAEARLQQSNISEEKVREHLARLVLEAHATSLSARDRLATARVLLKDAEEIVSLSDQRKEFGVGVVLEMIQAGKDLVRSQQEYLQAIADWNKAQLALAIYTGRLGTDMK